MKNQIAQVGQLVKFTGYSSEPPKNPAEPGTLFKVKAFNSKDGSYSFVTEEGKPCHEVLFDDEFVLEGEILPPPAPAPTKKKAANKAAVAAPVQEAEAEAEVDIPSVKKVKAAKGKASGAVGGIKVPAKKTAAKKEKAVKAAKPKKEKAAVEAKLDAEVNPLVLTDSVRAELESRSALESAAFLVQTREKTTFVLGGILAYIKRNHCQTELKGPDGQPAFEAGLQGFNAYVETTLGLKSRSAHYYVQVYEKLAPITTEERINSVGWSKLIQMVSLPLTEENVEEWMDRADSLKVGELKEAVKTSLVETGTKVHGNTELTKKTHFAFAVFADQGNVCKEALDKAKALLGDEKSLSECFAYICQQYLAE